ncbi:MAG: hypothetical protein VW547_03265 [Alphaproteobacteria bacterium]
MSVLPERSIEIDGNVIPRRRFMVWAWSYFAVFVALPVLAASALIDYLLYLTFIR